MPVTPFAFTFWLLLLFPLWFVLTGVVGVAGSIGISLSVLFPPPTSKSDKFNCVSDTFKLKLIILNKGEIILDDDATTSLTKDSLLNKAGLDLPFMIDLSTKLKYYNLLDDVELEMNRMVEKLWK